MSEIFKMGLPDPKLVRAFSNMLEHDMNDPRRAFPSPAGQTRPEFKKWARANQGLLSDIMEKTMKEELSGQAALNRELSDWLAVRRQIEKAAGRPLPPFPSPGRMKLLPSIIRMVFR